jgi:hypothetical protein
MSESTNNICSCQPLQQMKRDNTLLHRLDTNLGWLKAGINDGTAELDNIPCIEYTTIKFCPFCGGEISWTNW